MSDTVFAFESDFAGSLRCIPMAVRLKLDLVGIKLSLRQWSQLRTQQRAELLQADCGSPGDCSVYRSLVEAMLTSIGGEIERIMAADGSAWSQLAGVPDIVVRQSADKNVPSPTPAQWRNLTDVQRFALIKLTRPGHENENFVPAMQEFGLLEKPSQRPSWITGRCMFGGQAMRLTWLFSFWSTGLDSPVITRPVVCCSKAEK